jgi:hypothetical protein
MACRERMAAENEGPILDHYTIRWGSFQHFSESRWLARGWTLQELLALNMIGFYTMDWEFLGTREEHLYVISETTGIGHGILLWPWTIQNYSIATRLSWASR